VPLGEDILAAAVESFGRPDNEPDERARLTQLLEQVRNCMIEDPTESTRSRSNVEERALVSPSSTPPRQVSPSRQQRSSISPAKDQAAALAVRGMLEALNGSWKNSEGMLCIVTEGSCEFPDKKATYRIVANDDGTCLNLNGWLTTSISDDIVAWRRPNRDPAKPNKFMEWRRCG
jgi:hypothetical protein